MPVTHEMVDVAKSYLEANGAGQSVLDAQGLLDDAILGQARNERQALKLCRKTFLLAFNQFQPSRGHYQRQ